MKKRLADGGGGGGGCSGIESGANQHVPKISHLLGANAAINFQVIKIY